MLFEVKNIRKVICILLSVLLIIPFVRMGPSEVEAAGPITDIKLSYDVTAVDLNTAWTEGDVQNRFRSYANLDSPTTKCKIDSLNCWLMYNTATYPSFYPYGVKDGSNQVSSDKSYFFCFSVQLTDDIYDFCDAWKNCTELTCLDSITGHPDIYINETCMPKFTYVKMSNDGKSLDIYIIAFYDGKADTTEKVTGVTVDEDMKTMRPGMSHQFKYTVKGNSTNKKCIWTVIGAKSSDTYFDPDGKLYIGEDETVENLSCIAQSRFDSTKLYAFGIYINQKKDTEDIGVSSANDNIMLSPIYTQGEVASRIFDNIYINSFGLILDLNNSGLLYKDAKGSFHVINDTDTEMVNPDREYYIRYILYLDDGYTLPSCYDNIKSNVLYPASTFKNDSPITVNDVYSDKTMINYNSMSGTIKVYAPLDFETISLQDIEKELTISGIEDKVYTGNKLTQYLKIKMGSYTLRDGIDYYVSFTNNINPGKASITIAGLGLFSGTLHRTFNIIDDPDNKGKDTEKKYKNEWVDGKWYDEFGNSTYDGTLTWKQNEKGWWVEDSNGWYPQNEWQKIDGKWYFFLWDGYMDYSEYRDGCWLGADGAWDEAYSGGHWMSDATGWWYEDESGWYPVSKWLWIDGSCYYFEASGYMATSKYVDGCWVGADGAWVK